MLRVARLVLLLSLLVVVGCGPKHAPRKKTFPVTGVVTVDGQPANQVQVSLHDVNGIDVKQPTLSSALTGEDGKFSLNTYEIGDGVPEGDYKVTFLWGETNMLTMQYGGPDKLSDRYSNAESTTFRVKVEKGKPADMGKIELTTK